MEARTLATQIAYGRIAIGAAIMITPKLVVGRWVGPIAERPGGRVLSVAFGARDLAVGAGTAYALQNGANPRPWLLASVFTDAVDVVATFAARRSLPTLGASGTIAMAATSAAIGAWSVRELA